MEPLQGANIPEDLVERLRAQAVDLLRDLEALNKEMEMHRQEMQRSEAAGLRPPPSEAEKSLLAKINSFSEEADTDEVMRAFFDRIDSNKDGRVSSDEVNDQLQRVVARQRSTDGGSHAEALQKSLSGPVQEMEFTAFKKVASSVSHAHGHRIQWA